MKLKIGIVVLGLVLGCLAVAEALDEEVGGTSATATIKSPEDLRMLLREEQKKYAILAIPSTELYWSMRTDDIFVDWSEWPDSAKENAIAVLDENLIPRYEIHLWEDPETGNITIANAYGETMATLEPEEEFDSLGWAMDYFGFSAASKLTSFQQTIHASHHTALSLELTPILFAEVCAEIKEEEQALAMQEAFAIPMGGGMAMMSLPESPTNLVLAINGTNANSGVEIKIGYPETFTNRVEMYATTNLVEGDWEIVSSPLATTGQTSVAWTDTQTNLQFRAYRAGNADLDSDLDGLVDAREILLYGTSPDSPDSDGDFMDDAWELQYSLDPTNSLDMVLDPDHDMLPNVYEQYYGLNPGSNDSSSITKLRVDPDNPTVSNTYATIQEAFNASTAYSIIEITEGTYSGNWNTGLFFPDHPVMLMSDNWGTSKTTIVEYSNDFYDDIAAFIIDESQDNRTIVRGLTLRMDGEKDFQVGFWVGDGEPYSADGSVPFFDGVTVELGVSDVNIGYYCRDATGGSLVFNNCIIRGKRGKNHPLYGIYLIDSSTLKIGNCTFQDFAPEPYSYGVFFESTSGNYGGAANPVDVEIAGCAWDESFAASNAECFVRLENGVHYDVDVSDSIMPKEPSWFPPDTQSNLYITNALLSMGAHQTTNSRGINTGGATLTWYDFEGQPRDSYPDIGADEFGNFSTGDSDQDGLSDLEEATIHFSDMYDPDTDGDSVLDGIEVDDETSPTNMFNYMLTINGNATNQLNTNVTLRACCSHTSDVWNASASTTVDASGGFGFEDYLVDTTNGLWIQVLCDWNMNGVADSDEPLYQQTVVATGRQYACEFIIWDRDGDGVDDLSEYNCGTDPNDPEYYCITIFGTVSNHTHFSGAMGASLATGPAGEDIQVSTSITATNTFLFDHFMVTNAGPLTVHLFNDINSNIVHNAGELSVTNMMVVTGAVMEVEMELSLNTCDDDGDAILDFWEQRSGLDWTVEADAYLDPDNDGLYNLHEYWADTRVTVSNSGYAISDAMFAVDRKIAGLNPANSIRIFNADCYTTTNFVRNTNCWAYSYDLTCISPWNSLGQHERAGTLLTPRHVLFCAHLDFYVPEGHTVLFIDSSSSEVERSIIATEMLAHTNTATAYPDFVVGLLDSDVPTNMISSAKVLPDDYMDYIGNGQKLPSLCLDKEEKALVFDVQGTRIPNGNRLSTILKESTDASRGDFHEPLQGGDSGNPSFVVINDQLVLLTVWSSGLGAGTSVTDLKSEINTAIQNLDTQNNITNEYELTEIDLSGFEKLNLNGE